MSDLKEKIKEDYKDKDKLRYFFYEFIGTAILTFGYNMGANLYLIALWLCWEVTACHFNMAISLGYMITTLTEDKFVDHMTNYFIMCLVQFCGSLFGTALTFIAIIVKYT